MTFKEDGTLNLTNVAASRSEKFYVYDWAAISLHILWTGTPTGTFSLWASNKAQPDDEVDADWTDLGLTMPTAPAGSAGSNYLDITGLSARWLRLKYVRTGGTATALDIYVNRKDKSL